MDHNSSIIYSQVQVQLAYSLFMFGCMTVPPINTTRSSGIVGPKLIPVAFRCQCWKLHRWLTARGYLMSISILVGVALHFYRFLIQSAITTGTSIWEYPKLCTPRVKSEI